MEKIIYLVLDFLQISENERQWYFALCQLIQEHKDCPIQIYHRMGFFFESFYQLLHGEISEMDFLSTGDVISPVPLYGKKNESSRTFFTQKKSLLDTLTSQTLIVADEKSFLALSSQEQDEIKNSLAKSRSLLLLC